MNGFSHYFQSPEAADGPERTVTLADGTSLLSGRGTFSSTRLDPGTAELLRSQRPRPDSRELLDLGCGYGPIAVSLARWRPGATVWAVDVNTRAVSLTAANAERLGLPGIQVATPDAVPEQVRLDEIWSNPPIRIGKPALHHLLAAWLPRLAPDGLARLVVARNLGADSLATWLVRQGWQVERAASRKGYRILHVHRDR